MVLRRLLAISLFFSALLSAPQAEAQPLPFSLMMAPELMVRAERQQPIDPTLRLSAPDPELYRAQRRNRMVLAAGIGVVTSAVATAVASASRGGCRPRATQLAALAFAGVGVVFSIGGGFGLRRASREGLYPPTNGQRSAAVATALATGLTTQAALTALWFADAASCAN